MPSYSVFGTPRSISFGSSHPGGMRYDAEEEGRTYIVVMKELILTVTLAP